MRTTWIASVAVALAACLSGCGKSGESSPGGQTNEGSSPLTAPSDYLGAIHKGKVAAEKTVDVASINKAIEMYRVENGHNPKDLNELVEEKIMPALPKPPYGMQFKYDAASGQVSVVASPPQ